VSKHAVYRPIIEHYESCLDRFGDNHKGVDWPNESDARKRYQVMCDLIKPEQRANNVSLLDFGCGASHLYEYMMSRGDADITYAGLDISPKFIALSKSKFPKNQYFCADLLLDKDTIPAFDYVVMNGVFTEKRELAFDEMEEYFQNLVAAAFELARIGLAFNVMSKHVDWERNDLFHLSFDRLAEFLTRRLTRNFVFRADYGLYEYTTYMYK